MNFDMEIRKLSDRVFPTEQRDGPLGDVLVDAQLLRELLARYGGASLWRDAYRRKLKPFADAYHELQREAAVAASVGHMYPLDDYERATVFIGHLRLAAELLEENTARQPPEDEK